MTFKSEEARHIDIFIFNDDALRRLDSYQRSEGCGTVKVASRSGDKILVAIANSPVTREEWRRINSYESLAEEVALLEEEDSENPIMSGICRISPGDGEKYTVGLDRLVSKVRLKSIRADFSGREYEGCPLEDVKVYLTNVNAACKILKESDFRPEMIVNHGFLDEDALGGFRDRGIVQASLARAVGESGQTPDIGLYCYPNDALEETPGSPFTRLVIEGSIDGHRCWYPITVNRGDFGIMSGGDGTGIGRNRCYSYDIILHRAGTSGPDIPVSLDYVSILCNIEPWSEKDRETILF